MSTVVIIRANGEMKTGKFPKSKNVTIQHTWSTAEYDLQLYGRTTGTAGTENKYDFPPPMDTILFLGDVIIASPTCPVTEDMWTTFYEGIMQFEDLESETASEDEIDPDEEYTKEGYMKDGFVVSDSELEEEAYKIDINTSPDNA